MANIFIISDTHFGHENIIGYCDRPFKDTMQINMAMRDNWNSTVKPQDIVYHLGDVYMGWNEKQDIGQFLASLNGHKRLVLGNHDNGKDTILHKAFQKIMVWRMFPEFGLLLTHVPVHSSALRRGPKGEQTNKDLVNVHGHIHNNPSPDGPYINACVEWHSYRPVNIEEYRVV